MENIGNNIKEILQYSKNYKIKSNIIVLPDCIDLQEEHKTIDNTTKYKIYHIHNITCNKNNIEDKINDSLSNIKNNKNNNNYDSTKNILITNFTITNKSKDQNNNYLKFLNNQNFYDNDNDQNNDINEHNNSNDIIDTNIIKDSSLILSKKSNFKYFYSKFKNNNKKPTGNYIQQYCVLLKEILNNLEIKWDWANKTFLSNLSHQLKTPLTGILTGIQILESRLINEYDKNIIEYLFKSCLELSTYISDISEYYFISQNDIKIEIDTFNLNDIFYQIYDIFDLQFKSNRTLFIKNMNNINKIEQDKDKLFKIFYNLISNSLKFTVDGCIFINLKISSDSSKFYFQIFDTGRKIENDDKENIFKPFYQSNNQWETTQEGMGLGLSICQKLINCLNGNIYIAECDNQYLFDYISNHNNEIKNNYKFINCIEFWLPINNNTLFSSYTSYNSNLSETYSDNSNSLIISREDISNNLFVNSKIIKKKKKRKLPELPKHICNHKNNSNNKIINKKINKSLLLIEDHKINSKLIKLMINNFNPNINIEILNNPIESISRIMNNHYDYILLDLKMPVYSGFDILEDLKKNNFFNTKTNTKIIIITALICQTVNDLKSKYPTIDILFKPIEFKELSKLLK